jgi:hypothetical protein
VCVCVFPAPFAVLIFFPLVVPVRFFGLLSTETE